jgi:Transcriptional Coactivator p15 (PC4)
MSYRGGGRGGGRGGYKKFGGGGAQPESEIHHTTELSTKRKACVKTYSGAVFVDLREYWEDKTDPGVLKPGSKGIMLNMDQWKRLLADQDIINAKLREIDPAGMERPVEPVYSASGEAAGAGAGAGAAAEDEDPDAEQI